MTGYGKLGKDLFHIRFLFLSVAVFFEKVLLFLKP